MSRLWLFHLGAEEELAQLRSGRRFNGDVARREPRAVALLGRPIGGGGPGFLRPGDAYVGGHDARATARVGAAWCPTPAAIARLEREAAPLPAGEVVAPEVLIAANARETFADVDPFPGAQVVVDVEGLRGCLATPAPSRPSGQAPAWILRRSLCAAGQGRAVCEGWDARAESFARRALPLGPIHALPFVDVLAEFALHGRISRDGRLAAGRPVSQSASGGVWRGASAQHGLEDSEERRLVEALEHVAERLARLGYHGPFGIDAIRWTDARGRRRFSAPTDVNARYTMSFAIGAPSQIGPGQIGPGGRSG